MKWNGNYNTRPFIGGVEVYNIPYCELNWWVPLVIVAGEEPPRAKV